ncbi:hypothetical protein DOY81_012187, partial [Sarcophaga bullata]
MKIYSSFLSLFVKEKIETNKDSLSSIHFQTIIKVLRRSTNSTACAYTHFRLNNKQRQRQQQL